MVSVLAALAKFIYHTLNFWSLVRIRFDISRQYLWQIYERTPLCIVLRMILRSNLQIFQHLHIPVKWQR